MKKLVTIIFISITMNALAQDSLQNLSLARNNIKSTGMQVLGSWAAANIIVGGIGWASTNGQTKYFHQMNTIWGVANLGIAILGYTKTQHDKNKHYTAEESLREQKQIEKIFLVNGALDFAYIGAGIYLTHRGNVNNFDQCKGYGKAVILQGAFLLLFDATMYTSEKNAGSKLRNFLMKNPITFDGQKVGMVMNF